LAPDGKLYFGQGAATNSGVVGLDNAFPYVWLLLHPDVYDVPARDMRLKRESFLTPQPNNVLSRQGKLLSLGRNVSYAVNSIFNRKKSKSLLVRTEGISTIWRKKSQRERAGESNGTILRMNTDGTGLEVYALVSAIPSVYCGDPDGQLYVSDNAYDQRGSRPIANAKDNIFQIKKMDGMVS
jgi:hypothetical protein